MPSGSHGGSAGSHSGGSHSGGGFGFGGGFHGGRGPRRHLGPLRIMFFGRYYMFTSATQTVVSLLMFLMVFALALGFGMTGNLSSDKKTLSAIEQDYAYYQNMISVAEADPEYQTIARITDKQYHYEYEKWYFTYEIPYSESDYLPLTGYTFSVYTLEQISSFTVGQEIQVAINCKNTEISSTTDSIPMDYKNMPLERDGEWVYYHNAIKTAKNVQIGAFVFAGIMFAIAVTVFVVSLKKHPAKEQKNEASTKPEDPSDVEKSVIADEKLDSHCPYCGAKVVSKKRKCPNCGANLK